VRLVRPLGAGALYLRRVSDELEFALPMAPSVLNLTSLKATKPRVNSRGAANDAFSSTFSLPFDRSTVAAWVPPAVVPQSPSGRWVRPVAIGSFGLSVGALVFGLVANWAAFNANARLEASTPQLEVSGANRTIRSFNAMASGGYLAAGLFALTGVILWFLEPPSASVVELPSPSQGGGARW
jgi:hypothetical protein